MKFKSALFLLATASIATTSATEDSNTSCTALAARVKATAERTSVDPIELLSLVDREVSANPGCACEIVKAAIVGTDCDDAIIGYIVETAVRAAPETCARSPSAPSPPLPTRSFAFRK